MTVTSGIDLDETTRLRLAIARVSRRLRTVPAGQGMTPTQLSVLAATVRQGSARISELATTEAINPTMLSRIVSKLEAEGLVRRETDPDDARAVSVVATPAGRRRHERIRTERTQALAEVLERLEPHHARALNAAIPAIEELAAALQERPV